MLAEKTIHQGHLLKHLKQIFPNEDILVHISFFLSLFFIICFDSTTQTQENVKKAINIRYPTGEYMEIDVWLPGKHLCFEFQDSHHYITTWYHQHSLDQVRQKDNILMNEVEGYQGRSGEEGG